MKSFTMKEIDLNVKQRNKEIPFIQVFNCLLTINPNLILRLISAAENQSIYKIWFFI